MFFAKTVIKKCAPVLLLAVLPMMASCQQAEEGFALPPNADIDAVAAASLASAALQQQMPERHDRYAIYYTADEYAELFRTVTGSYSGIGIYIYPDDATGRALVYGVMKGGPAYEAGILPGDVFVSINGEELTALDYSAVADKLLAYPEGTKLNVVLERPEVGEVELTLKTAKVEIPTLDYKLLPDNLGLIKIASFNMNTGEQFTAAYDDLIEQGMQGLILDLRNNGGGEINAALHICNYFVPDGQPMMYITDAEGVYYYTANQETVDIPLAVLQNGHSASASEIVIGAVKDMGAGVLIGETTYGKGIVQDLRQLKSGAGLRFTSAKYSSAHEHDIHGVGIEADINFPMPEDAEPLADYTMEPERDPQLAKAMEILAEKLPQNAAGN